MSLIVILEIVQDRFVYAGEVWKGILLYQYIWNNAAIVLSAHFEILGGVIYFPIGIREDKAFQLPVVVEARILLL